MRSLMFLLVLLFFCSVLRTSSASDAADLANSNCCFKFTNKRIPVKQVKSYYRTNSICPTRAIVFQTFKEKEFCVDPEASWVKEHVTKVDKRTRA